MPFIKIHLKQEEYLAIQRRASKLGITGEDMAYRAIKCSTDPSCLDLKPGAHLRRHIDGRILPIVAFNWWENEHRSRLKILTYQLRSH
jgi:hypothetical protein